MSNGKNGFLSSDFWLRCESACYLLMVFAAVLTFWVGAKFFREVKDLSRPSLAYPSISVSGEGSVFVKPDVGVVSFSSFAESKDPLEAQRSSALNVNEALSFLKSSGIEEKDVKTLSYSIQPVYDFPKGRREFLGYQVSQTLEVKIRNLEKTGDILGGLASLGINEVGSLLFKVDDLESAKTQARAEAIADARKKAEALAVSLGVRLGKIVSFNEFEGGPTPIFALETFGRGGDFSAPVSPETPVGENEVKVSVSVTFEIK